MQNLEAIKAMIDAAGSDGVWTGTLRAEFDDADEVMDSLIESDEYVKAKAQPKGMPGRRWCMFNTTVAP